MRYGDTAVAGRSFMHGSAIVQRDDGRLDLATYDDRMRIVGYAWDDINEGDTVRLDPPPGVLRKVAVAAPPERAHPVCEGCGK